MLSSIQTKRILARGVRAGLVHYPDHVPLPVLGEIDLAEASRLVAFGSKAGLLQQRNAAQAAAAEQAANAALSAKAEAARARNHHAKPTTARNLILQLADSEVPFTYQDLGGSVSHGTFTSAIRLLVKEGLVRVKREAFRARQNSEPAQYIKA